MDTDLISHKKAQKARRKIRHGFTQIYTDFLTLISQITQWDFSQLCVLGGGFSRCEHLRKPAALVHKAI
jgi:hypothetical protein